MSSKCLSFTISKIFTNLCFHDIFFHYKDQKTCMYKKLLINSFTSVIYMGLNTVIVLSLHKIWQYSSPREAKIMTKCCNFEQKGGMSHFGNAANRSGLHRPFLSPVNQLFRQTISLSLGVVISSDKSMLHIQMYMHLLIFSYYAVTPLCSYNKSNKLDKLSTPVQNYFRTDEYIQ